MIRNELTILKRSPQYELCDSDKAMEPLAKVGYTTRMRLKGTKMGIEVTRDSRDNEKYSVAYGWKEV